MWMSQFTFFLEVHLSAWTKSILKNLQFLVSFKTQLAIITLIYNKKKTILAQKTTRKPLETLNWAKFPVGTPLLDQPAAETDLAEPDPSLGAIRTLEPFKNYRFVFRNEGALTWKMGFCVQEPFRGKKGRTLDFVPGDPSFFLRWIIFLLWLHKTY